jgi:hypothetical protein
MVAAEQVHQGFTEAFDETRVLRQRIRDLEVRGHKRSQDVEDIVAGAVALSDDVDSHDVAIKALEERVGVLEYALYGQTQKVQDLDLRLQKLERRFDLVGVGAAQQIAEIMAQS